MSVIIQSGAEQVMAVIKHHFHRGEASYTCSNSFLVIILIVLRENAYAICIYVCLGF